MHCKHCGTFLTGHESVCPYCGNQILQNTEQNVRKESTTPTPRQPQTNNSYTSDQPFASPQFGFCPRCGQKLNLDATRCTFCEQPISFPSPYAFGQDETSFYRNRSAAPVPERNIAKQSTILGVIALLVSIIVPYGYFIGWLMGIIAIVQGRKAKKTTAVVLGIITIAICAFAIAAFFLLLEGQTGNGTPMTIVLQPFFS